MATETIEGNYPVGSELRRQQVGERYWREEILFEAYRAAQATLWEKFGQMVNNADMFLFGVNSKNLGAALKQCADLHAALSAYTVAMSAWAQWASSEDALIRPESEVR